jgi:DNA-binding beta-propeller fold protein YncE
MTWRCVALVLVLARAAQAQGDPGYRLGVVSESGDIVTWLRPSGVGLALDHVVPVGVMPSDIDGPHNIAVAPDGKSYYVTIAHGTPYGSLWKLNTQGDSVLGRAQLEMFPTTIGLTPDGQFAFVANSDFHGDHPRVNVVSVIHTGTMNKITDIPACDMPHGVKANHAGARVYVSCMHSDEILELDVASLTITRRVKTGEHSSGAAVTATAVGAHHETAPASSSPGAHECSPTFVSVSPDDQRLYIACNYGNSLQVRDAGSLRLIKEIPVGKGAYNVEPSPDGKLVIVTNKKDQSASIIDAARLTELARIPTSKKIVHGVTYSPDNRLAYVSSESIGTDPGAVDIIDLAARKMVSTVAVPGQPTGVTILRTLSTASTH